MFQKFIMSRALIVLAFVLIIPASALAQRSRVTQQIDARRTRTLPGSVSPRARAENDLGPTDSREQLRGLTLMFRRSAAQQADLEQLLEQQQDPQSPQYHRWLTSEQYADRFGLSVDDIGRIRTWLESSGLKISEVARGRLWIVFEGDAGAIGTAFNTSFRRYRVEARRTGQIAMRCRFLPL